MVNPIEETRKIEASGIPEQGDAIAGEPEPGLDIAPETGTVNVTPQPSAFPNQQWGLLLSLEVPSEQATFGDLLNLIAHSWRGREDIEVRPNMDGAVRNDAGQPVGLWLISRD